MQLEKNSEKELWNVVKWWWTWASDKTTFGDRAPLLALYFCLMEQYVPQQTAQHLLPRIIWSNSVKNSENPTPCSKMRMHSPHHAHISNNRRALQGVTTHSRHIPHGVLPKQILKMAIFGPDTYVEESKCLLPCLPMETQGGGVCFR